MARWMAILVGLTVACVALTGCGDPAPSSMVLCKAETLHKGKLGGIGSGGRLAWADFDNANTRTTAFAHSGKHSVKLDPKHRFGMTYPIPYVQPGEFYRAKVWRRKSPHKSALVIASRRPGGVYVMQDLPSGNVQGEWEELLLHFVVPNHVQCETLYLYAYLVQPKGEVYFDDLQLVWSPKRFSDPPRRQSFMVDERDGRQYKTIAIGGQWWMAENLAYDGGIGGVCPEGGACDSLGRLYNYAEALKAMPAGWRLPTDQDWKHLEKAMGMHEPELSQWGSRGYNSAWSLRENGRLGFEALPAGVWDSVYAEQGHRAAFWSATLVAGDSGKAITREIGTGAGMERKRRGVGMRMSVRGVLDR